MVRSEGDDGERGDDDGREGDNGGREGDDSEERRRR